MKHLKKLTLTLLLLITAATGAWADDATYTVQFKANGKTVTRDVTLPHTFWCNVDNANGELDGIIMELYGWTGDGGVNYYCISTSTPQSTDPNKVNAGNTNSNHYITIDSKFDGTVTVSGRYSTSSGQATYSLDISFVVPAGTFSINDAKSEATMKMPQYDVTATYTLKRDMTVDVAGEMADRIRIKKDGNTFEPVGADGNIDASAALPTVSDNLDANNPVDMTKDTDYTLTLQKQSETDETVWTDVTDYSVGTFRYKITGAGNYSGICYSEEFALFEGYEIEIAAGEYATFYKDEALYVEDTDAQLYTVTAADAEKATATPVSVSAANTPLLVKNNGSTTKKILVIPSAPTQTPDVVTVFSGFKGTLAEKTFTNADMTVDHYICNGLQFVWVKSAGTIAANRCWIELPKQTAASARALKIVFGEATGVEDVKAAGEADDDSWYDLNGRKLPAAPTRKGVYIRNGRKVVIK